MDRGLSQERTGEESETRVGNKTEHAKAGNRLRSAGLIARGYIRVI